MLSFLVITVQDIYVCTEQTPEERIIGWLRTVAPSAPPCLSVRPIREIYAGLAELKDALLRFLSKSRGRVRAIAACRRVGGSMGGRLADLLESIPLVRKRFRKGNPWIREPIDASGGNSLQTTRAIELNVNIMRVIIDWMPTAKLSIHDLEPQAGPKPKHEAPIRTTALGSFSVQVKLLFKSLNHVPEDRKQAWIDSWSVRTLVSFALKRQRDSQRRGQVPRVPLPNYCMCSH